MPKMGHMWPENDNRQAARLQPCWVKALACIFLDPSYSFICQEIFGSGFGPPPSCSWTDWGRFWAARAPLGPSFLMGGRTGGGPGRGIRGPFLDSLGRLLGLTWSLLGSPFWNLEAKS